MYNPSTWEGRSRVKASGSISKKKKKQRTKENPTGISKSGFLHKTLI
jgi:hypothetical protein